MLHEDLCRWNGKNESVVSSCFQGRLRNQVYVCTRMCVCVCVYVREISLCIVGADILKDKSELSCQRLVATYLPQNKH